MRAEQPEDERIYFVRIFASHLRELLVLDYRDRQEVRDLVAELPARDARDEAERLLHSTFPSRPGVEVWKDVQP